MDYLQKEWDFILNVERNDVNHSFDNFILNMNGLLDKHAPFKKVRKYQLKLKTKPWIPVAIHKTIFVENSLFKKYIKMKDPAEKIEIHDKYKYCRNLLSTVIKKSKKKKIIMNSLKIRWIIWKTLGKESEIWYSGNNLLHHQIFIFHIYQWNSSKPLENCQHFYWLLQHNSKKQAFK